MRPPNGGFVTLLDLGEHGLPGNRIITRQQFDHALRALQPCGSSIGEQVRDVLIRGIILVAEHVYGDVLIRGGDFGAAEQRQTDPMGCGFGLRPAGGGVMIGNGHALESQCLGLFGQCGRRFRAIREDGMAMDVPPDGGRLQRHHISSHTFHRNLISAFPRKAQTGRHLLPTAKTRHPALS